ncbi:MAG TPA: TlpA disulfide reductase family protein [Anaerolineae bacterium]|jgi:cytochrome c biogenesis protein CcmG/thiol:disulfide interchange protein DsbE|nr:TlpA disulfide reductase family protein [Anaerolineae bacterium]
MSETTDTIDATPEAAPEETQKSRFGLVVLITVVLIFAAVLFLGMRNSATDRPDEVAPDFEMQFFNGYEWESAPTAQLSDFEGRPVVLNFWASWCVECRVEADLLEDTWKEYRDDGVVFLGIAYIDVEPKSLAYLEEYNITYPNAPDLRSSISSKYDITGVPETFFIDREGNVVHIQLGPVNETMLTSLIDQMLTGETTG